MTTHVHIFEYPVSLQSARKYLNDWGKRDTALPERMIFRKPGAPFLHSKVDVIEPTLGVIVVKFYDGRLPDEIRETAIGLAIDARLSDLLGERVRIALSCNQEEFLPHWEQLLADLGQTLPLQQEGEVATAEQSGQKKAVNPSPEGQTLERDEVPTPEKLLSGVEKGRLAVCRVAREAKDKGVTFKDFCAQRGDNPTEATLRRWFRELKGKGIKGLDWR